MHLMEGSVSCLICLASLAEQFVCNIRFQGESHLVTISNREQPQERIDGTHYQCQIGNTAQSVDFDSVNIRLWLLQFVLQ